MLQVKVLSWEPTLAGKALISAAIINAPLPKQQKMPHPQKAHTPTILSSCLDCIHFFFFAHSQCPLLHRYLQMDNHESCHENWLVMTNFLWIFCLLFHLTTQQKKENAFLNFFNVTYFFLYFDILFRQDL